MAAQKKFYEENEKGKRVGIHFSTDQLKKLKVLQVMVGKSETEVITELVEKAFAEQVENVAAESSKGKDK